MHVLTLEEPVNLGKTLGVLEKGRWLMHDLNAFEIARMAPRGTVKVAGWSSSPPNFERSHTELVIMRSGAIGDLLLLTPALRALRLETKARITLSCFSHHHDIFLGTNLVDALVRYPVLVESLKFYPFILSLENTMECDHTQHATDVFAKALGLKTPLADYRPVYHVTDAEKEATAPYVFKERPTLAVQIKASVANRDYPMPQWLEVIKKLEERGWGIVLLGSKGQVAPLPPQVASPFIRNLSDVGLTFRESAAVLSQCQAFVGVDSAWAHMCHALDIPAVVLFAAFPWQIRTSKAPKTIALTGVGECAPCNWHIHAGRQFPPGKPCTASQKCVVLAGITPDRIVSKVSLLKP